MGKVKAKSPVPLITLVFLLCFAVRYAEVVGPRLDESFLGENILHKLFGIVLLFDFGGAPAVEREAPV